MHGRFQEARCLAASARTQFEPLAMSIRGASFISLRSQMVRAALSIPANIVEGRAQKTDRQFSGYLRISLNSSSELEYHLITARDLDLIPPEIFNSLAAELSEIRQMLYGLIRKLEANGHRAPTHS